MLFENNGLILVNCPGTGKTIPWGPNIYKNIHFFVLVISRVIIHIKQLCSTCLPRCSMRGFKIIGGLVLKQIDSYGFCHILNPCYTRAASSRRSSLENIKQLAKTHFMNR